MAIQPMELARFQREMRDWAVRHVPEIGTLIHRKVSDHIYQGIVQKTPVLTGRARGNWYPSNGAPSTQVGEHVAGVSVTGQPMTSEEKARITTVTNKLKVLPLGAEKVFITNNLWYIQGLEDGTISQKTPPNAMVQGTIINTLDGLKVDIRASNIGKG